MNIAYSCNDNYIQHTGISLVSLFENNKSIFEINIYFVSVNVSKKNLALLRNICNKYLRKLVILNFEDLCPELSIVYTGRHIQSVYAKLFFGNLENIDKIIYLDSDTIINGSLQSMWDIDLENHYFCLHKTITKSVTKKLKLNYFDPFFNDGIAIVNCQLLRKDNLKYKFIDFINKFNGVPPFLSEGVINVVCKNKISILPPRFNYFSVFFLFSFQELNILAMEEEYISEELFIEESLNPIIIHYLAEWFNRPWHSNCIHPMKDLYIKYKEMSPWKDVGLLNGQLPNKLKILKALYGFLGSKNYSKLLSLYLKIKMKFEIG